MSFKHYAALLNFKHLSLCVGDANKYAVFIDRIHHCRLAFSPCGDIRLIVGHILCLTCVSEVFNPAYQIVGGRFFKEYLTVVFYALVKDLMKGIVLGGDE